LEDTLSKIVISFLAAMIAVAAMADSKTQAPPLPVAIAGSKVTVTGATPGGRVVFFGIGRFVKERRVTVRRFDKIVADDNNDGTVVLEIGEKLPWKTVFAAVDLTSGRYGLATMSDFPLMTIEFEKDPMVANNGQLNKIVFQHKFLDLVVVRPGVGAWGQILADGNKFDDDGKGDGTIVGNVEKSVPVSDDGPPPPKKFEKGDIVVLIDADRMQTYAVEVGAK
jgi:hypothetical protein